MVASRVRSPVEKDKLAKLPGSRTVDDFGKIEGVGAARVTRETTLALRCAIVREPADRSTTGLN
jgi:hypothetical protein